MTVSVERNQAGLSNIIPSALNNLLEECQHVFVVPNSIALNSSNGSKGVSSNGPSIASVPKNRSSIRRVPKEGASQELLDWYGYDIVEGYLEDTFFDSTYKDTRSLLHDNIIPKPDLALELGKSISLTEAEEEAVAREVHATHARIVSGPDPEPMQEDQTG
ncbi:hypothetical protein Tco_0103823 [Tanacetum coccineum]